MLFLMNIAFISFVAGLCVANAYRRNFAVHSALDALTALIRTPLDAITSRLKKQPERPERELDKAA